MPYQQRERATPQVDGTELDLFAIFQEVARRGGYEAVTIHRRGAPAS